MRRWLAAAVASASTVPLIGLAGTVLTYSANSGNRDVGRHLSMSALMATGGLLFLVFGLLAMLVIGWPSIWMASWLFARPPFLRSAVLMIEGLVIGTIYFGSVNTPAAADWSDVGIGGSVGAFAALSASTFFSLFHKDTHRA